MKLFKGNITKEAWGTTAASSFLVAELRKAKDPVVRHTVNGNYSLSFDYPVGGLVPLNIEADMVVSAAGQPFRIQSIQRIGEGGKKYLRFEALHVFFDLEYSTIENIETSETTPGGIPATEALTQILARTPFTKGIVDTTVVLDYLDVLQQSRLSVIKSQLLELWGGELELDAWTVGLRKELPPVHTAQMPYRLKEYVNIRGINYSETLDGVITRLHVIGYNKANFESINDGKDYIDSPNINKYANIKEGYVTFSDDDLPEDLMAKALEYLPTVDKPRVHIQIDIQSMKEDQRWAAFKDLETLGIGEKVSIHHSVLDMEVVTRVLHIEFNPVTGKNHRIELGNDLTNIYTSIANAYQAAEVIHRITSRGRHLRAESLRGTIDLLTTYLYASGSYTQAEVIDGKGSLYENTNEESSDFGAIYIGPGILAIADSKKADGSWDWRTFGTGKGFYGDEIVAGTITADKVSSNFGEMLDLRSNKSIRLSVSGILNYFRNGGFNYGETPNNWKQSSGGMKITGNNVFGQKTVEVYITAGNSTGNIYNESDFAWEYTNYGKDYTAVVQLHPIDTDSVTLRFCGQDVTINNLEDRKTVILKFEVKNYQKPTAPNPDHAKVVISAPYRTGLNACTIIVDWMTIVEGDNPPEIWFESFYGLLEKINNVEFLIDDDSIISKVTSSQVFDDKVSDAVSSGISGKADKSELAGYTPIATHNTLVSRVSSAEEKITDEAITNTVTSSSVYKSALAAKVDTSTLTTELAKKADTSALAAKADVSALAAKADISALEGKADKSDLNAYTKNTTHNQLVARVSTAEQKITDDSIIGIVTSSSTYLNNLSGKLSTVDFATVLAQNYNSIIAEVRTSIGDSGVTEISGIHILPFLIRVFSAAVLRLEADTTLDIQGADVNTFTDLFRIFTLAGLEMFTLTEGKLAVNAEVMTAKRIIADVVNTFTGYIVPWAGSLQATIENLPKHIGSNEARINVPAGNHGDINIWNYTGGVITLELASGAVIGKLWVSDCSSVSIYGPSNKNAVINYIKCSRSKLWVNRVTVIGTRGVTDGGIDMSQCTFGIIDTEVKRCKDAIIARHGSTGYVENCSGGVINGTGSTGVENTGWSVMAIDGSHVGLTGTIPASNYGGTYSGNGTIVGNATQAGIAAASPPPPPVPDYKAVNASAGYRMVRIYTRKETRSASGTTFDETYKSTNSWSSNPPRQGAMQHAWGEWIGHGTQAASRYCQKDYYYSLWMFPSVITTGKTIKSAVLTLRRSGSYGSSGAATIRLYKHNLTSAPTGTSYSMLTDTGITATLQRGEVVSINLPSSVYNGLQNGSIRGFGLYNSGNFCQMEVSASLEVKY